MNDATRARVNANARRRRKLKGYGRWVAPYVDAGPARLHVADLRAYGLSKASIARLAGVRDELVERLMRPGHQRRIARATEAAILAARFDLDRLDPDAQVDVIGTQRRLRALAVMGWSRDDIYRALGFQSLGAIAHMLNPNTRYVTVRNARAVRDLYDAVSMRRGPSPIAATRAAANHWLPPLAWDDDALDNPDARPDFEAVRPRTTKQRRPVDVAEDVEWLLRHDDADATTRALAERLGYEGPTGLSNALESAGRRDLLDRLSDNAERAGHNVAGRRSDDDEAA